jgi:hypothetical protein
MLQPSLADRFAYIKKEPGEEELNPSSIKAWCLLPSSPECHRKKLRLPLSLKMLK